MVVNLKDLGIDKYERGGLYCLAPKKPKDGEKDEKFNVKIGRTVNFKNRLNDYHLCYNDGYYIICLLPLINRVPMKDRKKITMAMEKLVGELLGKPRTYPNRESRGSEWYYKSTNEVEKVFKEVRKTFRIKDGKGTAAGYGVTAPVHTNISNDYVNKFNLLKEDKTALRVQSSNENTVKIKRYRGSQAVEPRSSRRQNAILASLRGN